jgi:hypothetical protein
VTLLLRVGLVRANLDPHDRGIFDRLIYALSVRVHKLAGARRADVLEIIERGAAGDDDLDGELPSDPLAGYSPADLLAGYGTNHGFHYGGAQYGGRKDLCHVLPLLRTLDQAGTTKQIWQWLWRRWPIFREIFGEALGLTGDGAGLNSGGLVPPPRSPDDLTSELPALASGTQSPAANPVTQEVSSEDDRAMFLDFPTRERLLLTALWKKGNVAILKVQRAIWPTKLPNQPLDALNKLKGRTTAKLTMKDYNLQVQQEGQTLKLTAVDTSRPTFPPP